VLTKHDGYEAVARLLQLADAGKLTVMISALSLVEVRGQEQPGGGVGGVQVVVENAVERRVSFGVGVVGWVIRCARDSSAIRGLTCSAGAVPLWRMAGRLALGNHWSCYSV
jgi:hypothetical protein